MPVGYPGKENVWNTHLDFCPQNAEKDSKVWLSPSSRYAEWRLRSGAVLCLRDQRDLPPERLLQAVWFHQRLCRDRLRTADGRSLQVLHPGFWNREAGPDFRRAMLRWEGSPSCCGDVEIDLHSHNWRAHGHDRNPDFA